MVAKAAVSTWQTASMRPMVVAWRSDGAIGLGGRTEPWSANHVVVGFVGKSDTDKERWASESSVWSSGNS